MIPTELVCESRCFLIDVNFPLLLINCLTEKEQKSLIALGQKVLRGKTEERTSGKTGEMIGETTGVAIEATTQGVMIVASMAEIGSDDATASTSAIATIEEEAAVGTRGTVEIGTTDGDRISTVVGTILEAAAMMIVADLTTAEMIEETVSTMIDLSLPQL